MLTLNISQNLLKMDEFGRFNGILIVDKPVGATSHDIVAIARKEFKTKKIGHAGTLDPFASGLLVLLVGKSTKLSDTILGSRKQYVATVLFGLETDTLDPEGKIVSSAENSEIKKESLEKVLETFQPEYKQFVPLFSSVKVGGEKLRKLVRRADSYEIIQQENDQLVQFKKDGKVFQEIVRPNKIVKLYKLELLNLKSIKTQKDFDLQNAVMSEDVRNSIEKSNNLLAADLIIDCSKGTYIRQLAFDIGNKLHLPAMLLQLRRTKVGEYSLV